MVGDTTLGIENMCFGKLEILCDEECNEGIVTSINSFKIFSRNICFKKSRYAILSNWIDL